MEKINPVTAEMFNTLNPDSSDVIVAGQVLSVREKKDIIFADLGLPGVDQIQAVLHKSSDIEDSHDPPHIGDIISVEGTAGETKRSIKLGLGQTSIFSTSGYKVLARSTRPRWSGEDESERQTKQSNYVKNLLQRSSLHSNIRKFYDGRGYTHVDTSILQESPSGAEARPFRTEANFDDSTRYLRIAPEVDLKIVMALSGLSRVYELARNFRNEGVSVAHHPEFSVIESYTAHASKNNAIEQVADLSNVISESLDIDNPFEDLKYSSYGDLFEAFLGSGFSFDKILSFEDPGELDNYLTQAVSKIGIHPEFYSKGPNGKLDYIFKNRIRPKLIGTYVVTGYLTEQMPLAKAEAQDSRIADCFQVLINGKEVVKAYSEETDPVLLEDKLNKQSKESEGESIVKDQRLIEACKMGLPPMYGVGVGLDRLHAILSGADKITEVIPMPINSTLLDS